MFVSILIFPHFEFLSRFFSDKFGSNHHFAGVKPFEELLNEHPNGFAYVAEEISMPTFKAMAKDLRSFDLMEDSLGKYDLL